MRVGIDARVLGSHTGGDETYVRNVIRALGAVSPSEDYTVFLGSPLPVDRIPGAQRMRRVVVRPHTSRLPNPFAMPLALARFRIEVAHAQYMAPWLYPTRIVVSVHDIAYERHPELFAPKSIAGMRRFVPPTIRRAAAVLTLSEFSKRDIVQCYRVSPEKVVVAPCAADPMFRPLHDGERLAAIRARYATGEHFILSVGNLQPRKNLRSLIAAYVKLRQAGATRHKLVLVGRKAWLYDDTFAAARTSGYHEDIVFTDYVPDEDLVALYNAADLFVYPSIYEGFGLPPVEAMACGTPAITSNTSSFPEILGEAALMVSPFDAEALARTMADVLGNADLRAELSARGLRRTTAFSWEATARTILDVYRKALRRS